MNANLCTRAVSVCRLSAFCVLASLAANASADSLRAPVLVDDAQRPVGYELQVLSSATSLKCDASHSFRQTLSVCGASGCRTRDVTESRKLHFDASENGRITVATSATYSLDGIVYGESEVDQVRVGKTGRFVQTVVGHSGCLKSVAFELRPSSD